MNRYVIIVAGGSGKRMGSKLPKQFIEINKKPIIFHTIERFLAFSSSVHFIIALHEDYQNLFEDYYKQWNYTFNYEFSLSGKERFDTVKNALEKVKEGVVGIHDAVRPFVSKETIENCLDELKKSSGVVPVIDLVDSIRQVNQDGSIALNRSYYKLVQTPQYFHAALIKKAYEVNFSSQFTDDASVFEHTGNKISVVEGNEENIKITTPKDLVLAEYFLKSIV